MKNHARMHTSMQSHTQSLPLPLCPTGTSLSEDSVDVEALSNNTNGVVFFNGGTYSAGPDFIGVLSCVHYLVAHDEALVRGIHILFARLLEGMNVHQLC